MKLLDKIIKLLSESQKNDLNSEDAYKLLLNNIAHILDCRIIPNFASFYHSWGIINWIKLFTNCSFKINTIYAG